MARRVFGIKKESSISSSDFESLDFQAGQDSNGNIWSDIIEDPVYDYTSSGHDKFDDIKAGRIQVRNGDKDEGEDKTIEKIQKRLEHYGYGLKEYGTDGKFGQETESAVIRFQTTNGLSPTGAVGLKTLNLLDSSFAKRFDPIAIENAGGTGGGYLDEDLYEDSFYKDIEFGSDLNRDGSNASLNAFARAIAKRESGGDYNAENKESKAHGKYQIMPKNWPRWARQAGLSRSAEKTPENQEIVAKYKFRKYFDELGEWWLVAVKWYSGGGGVRRMKRLRETDPSLTSARKSIRYKGGKTKYSGIATYADKVMKEYYSNMGQTYDGVRVYTSSDKVSHKLHALDQYLKKNGFKKESYLLDFFLKKASSKSEDNYTIPFGAHSTIPFDLDETPKAQIAPSGHFSVSEEALKKNNIEVIKYIAGTEAGGRGEGVRTAEGNIYEVLYEGARAVAKVVPITNLEPDIWKKILEIEFTEKQRRYLPKIYDIIEDRYNTIIIMEVLEPFSGHMSAILRTRRNRESEDLFRNEEFVHEAVIRAFEKAAEHLRGRAATSDEKTIYGAFISEQENIKRHLERSMFIEETTLNTVSDFVASKLLIISQMLALNDDSFISEISDEVQKNINLYFESSERPIPKYYSTEGVDETIQLLKERLQNNAQGYTASRNRRRLEALIKEREEAVYTESPEGFFYSENYMPETEGLFSLLKTLREHGINWSDVHAKNLMQRPGSREPVIIDVGLYELTQ